MDVLFHEMTRCRICRVVYAFPIAQFHATGGEASEVLFCFSVDFSVGPFAAVVKGDEAGTGAGAGAGEKKVGEAAAIVRKQVLQHLELGDASFWKPEVLHRALVKEQK